MKNILTCPYVAYLFRILQLCKEIPKGITDTVIQNDMPQFDANERVMAINRLLSAVRLSETCIVVVG